MQIVFKWNALLTVCCLAHNNCPCAPEFDWAAAWPIITLILTVPHCNSPFCLTNKPQSRVKLVFRHFIPHDNVIFHSPLWLMLVISSHCMNMITAKSVSHCSSKTDSHKKTSPKFYLIGIDLEIHFPTELASTLIKHTWTIVFRIITKLQGKFSFSSVVRALR